MLGLIVLSTNSQTSTIHASGGKNDECEDAQVRSFESGSDSEMTYSAPDGKVIDGVCIKSGVNMFDDKHSQSLGNGTYENGCYIVEGVGTSSVTVRRTNEGRDCQGLSHLDIYTSDAKNEDPDPEPTPTDEPGRGGDPEEPNDEPNQESNDDSNDNGGSSDNSNNDSSDGEVLGASTTALPNTGNNLLSTIGYSLLALGLASLEGIYLFKRLKTLHFI